MASDSEVSGIWNQALLDAAGGSIKESFRVGDSISNDIRRHALTRNPKMLNMTDIDEPTPTPPTQNPKIPPWNDNIYVYTHVTDKPGKGGKTDK